MSARAVQRLRKADWRRRLRGERLRRTGHTPESYEAALIQALDVWCRRRPWRWLPELVATSLFTVLGRRFAARWIAGGRR